MGRVISVNHQPCTGCKTCEIVCSLYHFGECNPARSAIRVIRRERNGLIFCLPLVCQQCEPAPCIDACPAGALCRSEENGAMAFDGEACTACGLCAEACPIGCLTLRGDGTGITRCDLCGGEPQCVPACHAHCLSMEDIVEVSGERNTDQIIDILKRKGLIDGLDRRRNG